MNRLCWKGFIRVTKCFKGFNSSLNKFKLHVFKFLDKISKIGNVSNKFNKIASRNDTELITSGLYVHNGVRFDYKWVTNATFYTSAMLNGGHFGKWLPRLSW